MDILEKIIATKRIEVEELKKSVTVKDLEGTDSFRRDVISMSTGLRSKKPAAIIAEFKRRSPSKGDIFGDAKVAEVVTAYAAAGCAGISVLTDVQYFGGSLEDLKAARAHVQVPLLRKDFMIDEFQILEARSAGADVILLIAEVLNVAEVKALAKFAKGLGLEVLLEMHSGAQVDKINEYVDIVGINNRDLKTFEVDTDASIRLLDSLEGDFMRISESGLSDPATVVKLEAAGFEGYLVGENFMKTGTPGTACASFISEILSQTGVQE